MIMSGNYRVQTVPTTKSAPNCAKCSEVVEMAKELRAPYILEQEPAAMAPAAAWGSGHVVVPAWREVGENVLDAAGYRRLLDELNAELIDRVDRKITCPQLTRIPSMKYDKEAPVKIVDLAGGA